MPGLGSSVPLLDLIKGCDPALEGLGEGAGEGGALGDHGWGWAEFAEDGRHLGFTQDGEGHADGWLRLSSDDWWDVLLDAVGETAAALGLEAVGSIKGGGTAGLSRAQSEEDVGADAVGLLGLGRPVEVVQGNGLGARFGQGPDDGVGQGVEAARLADDDAAAVEGSGRAPEGLTLADVGDGDGVLAAGPDSRQEGEGRRPTDGVTGQSGVALELEDGPLGVLAEDAVDPAGVEPEGAQAALQVGDVVPSQRGRGVVQQPVAQLVAGFDERAPGLGPADAVDAQPPPLLERPHGHFGGGAVEAGPVRAGVVPGGAQPGLEVPNGLARCPLAEEGLEAPGYRNSASSWASCPFPLAPIRRFLATPSWNTTSVGMLMIS